MKCINFVEPKKREGVLAGDQAKPGNLVRRLWQTSPVENICTVIYHKPYICLNLKVWYGDKIRRDKLLAHDGAVVKGMTKHLNK